MAIGRPRLLAFLAMCGAVHANAATLPGLGADNPRQRVDMAASPWRSLVRVQAPGLARCTGFLVAPDRVVTAAHCLYSSRLGRFIPAGSVHVLLGYSAGGFAGHGTAATYRTAEGYDPRRRDATLGADIAVLTLATPLAGPVLALDDAPAGAAVALGGYNQDRAEVIEADLACDLGRHAQDGEGRAMRHHDCAATSGSSGAPLLARAADGAWVVVGVQVAGRIGKAGGLAVPAASVRTLLAP